MRILLDLHVFLWFIGGDKRLPRAWVHAIRDPSAAVFLSVVSVWEASIKYRLGKLPLPQPPDVYLPAARGQHQIASLALDEASICRLAELPALHRDPFDRALLCQCMEHDLTLNTADEALRAYPVKLAALP